MTPKFNPESATTLLALIGVEISPGRATSAAQALNLLVGNAGRAFSALPFEAEPSTFLRVCDEQAP